MCLQECLCVCSKNVAREQEVQKLYEEMEMQIQSEKQRIVAEVGYWLACAFSQSRSHTYMLSCNKSVYSIRRLFVCSFTQPPFGRRRMRICFADVFFVFFLFFFVFFCFFPVRQKYETTVLGNGWTDFHETFTKRYREKCRLKCRAAAWRKSCRRLAKGECWFA